MKLMKRHELVAENAPENKRSSTWSASGKKVALAAQANAHAHTVKSFPFWILYWIVEEDACAGAGEP